MFCAENLLWIISSSTFSVVQGSNTILQTQENVDILEDEIDQNMLGTHEFSRLLN